MAQAPATRLAKRLQDGTITKRALVKNPDGSIEEVEQVIIDNENPTVPTDFAQAIINLINSGQISLPEGPNQHIVDISSQLNTGRYNYTFVSSNGSQKKAGSIYRIFFNGLNVTMDVQISSDRESFTFSNLYEPGSFDQTSILIIDFMEEE